MTEYPPKIRECSDGQVSMTANMIVNMLTMREFMLEVDSLEWRTSLISEVDPPAFSKSVEEYIRRATEMLKVLREQLEYLDHIRLEHDCLVDKSSKEHL